MTADEARQRSLARMPVWSRARLGLARAQGLSEAHSQDQEGWTSGKTARALSAPPADLPGLVMEDLPESVYDCYLRRLTDVVTDLERELDAQQRRAI